MTGMYENQDTEVTLSTGKLLGIFFGAAMICGIFFSFGYAVGKNSAPAASVAIMDSSALSNVVASGGAKPAPAKADVGTPCSADDSNCKKEDADQTSNADAGALPSAPEMTVKPAQSSLSPANGFIVQVAAVSKSEDADALKSALEKKHYPVFVVDNAASKLFHVQVGPFSEQKDAEAMKNKLASDGYNAILKK